MRRREIAPAERSDKPFSMASSQGQDGRLVNADLAESARPARSVRLGTADIGATFSMRPMPCRKPFADRKPRRPTNKSATPPRMSRH
jgi:hypothetical protein